jgi:hypothetical protein
MERAKCGPQFKPDIQEERSTTTMSPNDTITSPVAAVPSARPDRGRVLRLVFGGLGLLAALAFVGAGATSTWALETKQDGSGYFATGVHRFQTSSYALATESLDATTGWASWAERLGGRIRITATSTDPAKPLFVGIARTEDVDRYLANVEHDQVGDLKLDPFSVQYQRQSGHAPATRPNASGIWQTKATGAGTQTITWPLQGGHWSAVVMNADGSSPVAVDSRVAAKVSYLSWIVAGLFVLGGLSLIGGGALAYSGFRTKGDR